MALIELRGDDDGAGRANVLFLFVVVWASRHRRLSGRPRVRRAEALAAVSPNKTWSGRPAGCWPADAGRPGWPRMCWTPAAVPLVAGRRSRRCSACLAQAGDLFESCDQAAFPREGQLRTSSPAMAACWTGWTACCPRRRSAALLAFALG